MALFLLAIVGVGAGCGVAFSSWVVSPRRRRCSTAMLAVRVVCIMQCHVSTHTLSLSRQGQGHRCACVCVCGAESSWQFSTLCTQPARDEVRERESAPGSDYLPEILHTPLRAQPCCAAVCDVHHGKLHAVLVQGCGLCRCTCILAYVLCSLSSRTLQIFF